MIAFVTSIGETTTDLCVWSLERQGFDVVLLEDQNTLWSKLKFIFQSAHEDFLRVDADVVVNSNIQDLIKLDDLLWYQSFTFGWFMQDVIHGGVQFIRRPAIPIVLRHIDEARDKERPESYLCRLEEFHNPRTFGTFEKICGIHGYKQSDIQRIKDTKMRRGHYGDYDWQLAERLEAL